MDCLPCLLAFVQHLPFLGSLHLYFSSATGLSGFSAEMLSIFAQLGAEVHGPLRVSLQSRPYIEEACLYFADKGAACFDMGHAENSPVARAESPAEGEMPQYYSNLPRAPL